MEGGRCRVGGRHFQAARWVESLSTLNEGPWAHCVNQLTYVFDNMTVMRAPKKLSIGALSRQFPFLLIDALLPFASSNLR
jgi:hypothetical protein